MASSQQDKDKRYPPGVKVVSILSGDNKTFPKKGDTLTMHYTGTYYGGSKHGFVTVGVYLALLDCAENETNISINQFIDTDSTNTTIFDD